jgi:hypothetical protein
VAYEDGDVEIIPLWAPQQMIQLLNTSGEWIINAQQLQTQKVAAAQRLAQDQAAARVVSRHWQVSVQRCCSRRMVCPNCVLALLEENFMQEW